MKLAQVKDPTSQLQGPRQEQVQVGRKSVHHRTIPAFPLGAMRIVYPWDSIRHSVHLSLRSRWGRSKIPKTRPAYPCNLLLTIGTYHHND